MHMALHHKGSHACIQAALILCPNLQEFTQEL